MSNGGSLNRTSSGPPLIVKAFIAGIVIAAIGSVFAWLGKLISGAPEPIPVIDPLRGATSPAEMNQKLDALLAMSAQAITHDSALAKNLGILVAVLCALSLTCTLCYVLKMRRKEQPVPPTWRTILVILVLALVPVLATCTVMIKESTLLQASPVLQSMANENTTPAVVSPGEEVSIGFPLQVRSNRSYYEEAVLNIEKALAQTVDGQTIPVVFTAPKTSGGGSKPGKTDFIPVWENVKIHATMKIPDDPKLSGAIIQLSSSGSALILPEGSPNTLSRINFTSAATFRVAREKEQQFKTQFDKVTATLSSYNYWSWPSAAVVFIAIMFLTPSACKRCKKKLNVFKLMDGHLCGVCFEAVKKEKESRDPASSTQA
jgi:hypothetical protein